MLDNPLQTTGKLQHSCSANLVLSNILSCYRPYLDNFVFSFRFSWNTQKHSLDFAVLWLKRLKVCAKEEEGEG